jgi:hypothetical protein
VTRFQNDVSFQAGSKAEQLTPKTAGRDGAREHLEPVVAFWDWRVFSEVNCLVSPRLHVLESLRRFKAILTPELMGLQPVRQLEGEIVIFLRSTHQLCS